MSDPTGASVRITFRVFSSLQEYAGKTHERTFHNVPHSTADQIADDFATYSNGDESVAEQVFYKYQRVTDNGQGEEVFLPLDFDEVQSLSVVMDDRTREIHASDV